MDTTFNFYRSSADDYAIKKVAEQAGQARDVNTTIMGGLDHPKRGQVWLVSVETQSSGLTRIFTVRKTGESESGRAIFEATYHARSLHSDRSPGKLSAKRTPVWVASLFRAACCPGGTVTRHWHGNKIASRLGYTIGNARRRQNPLMVKLATEELRKLQTKKQRKPWSDNPTCPRCLHYNAMLPTGEGENLSCRDCEFEQVC